MKLQNVIFDLGGVLLNLEFARTTRAFDALGAHDFDSLWTGTRQTSLFDAFETGKIDAAAFRDGLREALCLPLTDAQIDTAWNAMLLDLPEPRLQFLRGLRPRYQIYLLSNTNEIHLGHLRTYVGDLDGHFDQAYYSHTLGHRKPTAQAFRTVLDAHSMRSDATLFVDDLLVNINAARQVGLHVVHVDPSRNLESQLALLV